MEEYNNPNTDTNNENSDVQYADVGKTDENRKKDEPIDKDYLSTMEPVVLIDKSRNKEAHLITSTRNDFGDLLESARRINTGLFKGTWDLCYLHPQTNKPVYIDEDRQISDIVGEGVNTFYWKYKKRAYKLPTKSDYQNESYKKDAKKWASNNRKKQTQQRTATQQQSKTRNKRAPGKRPGAGLQVLEYAYMSKRSIAFLIDFILLTMIAGLFGFEGISLLIGWLYFALLESSDSQATIGKKMMGLKVSDLNGRRLSFWQATVRHFGKWVSNITFGLGYLVAGITEKKQALHDIIAGTVVWEEKLHATPPQKTLTDKDYKHKKGKPVTTYYIRIGRPRR